MKRSEKQHELSTFKTFRKRQFFRDYAQRGGSLFINHGWEREAERFQKGEMRESWRNINNRELFDVLQTQSFALIAMSRARR